MGLTEEQLAIRRTGITATDAAKILGLSPYGCGEDVRLDKMGAGEHGLVAEEMKTVRHLPVSTMRSFCRFMTGWLTLG